MNSTLDLAELLNIILQLTTRHTGAERGTVFLVDSERDEIWSLVGLGLDQHEIRLPISRGIAGWVAAHGETVNLPDAYADPRFESEVDLRLGYRTKSLLCLPIRSKSDETIGVLQLLNKKTGPFTGADENLLRAISDHVALALENAQLHRDLLHKQRMERDLALARSIQLGLLPERPPTLEGFDIGVSHRPSLEVGGDYYDFIPLAPDTILTVVADVEGKGVGSAMVMANLQATLHALLAHLHSLEALGGIAERHDAGGYARAEVHDHVCGIARPAAPDFTLCECGARAACGGAGEWRSGIFDRRRNGSGAFCGSALRARAREIASRGRGGILHGRDYGSE